MTAITIALTGAGGSGVILVGEMLLQAAAQAGLYGILRKTFGPQIRGGESAAILRLGPQPLASFTNQVDLLLALDWSHFQRFADEIPLTGDTCIIEDRNAGPRPAELPAGAPVQVLDFTATAKQLGSAHSNMAALGFLVAWLGCDLSRLQETLQRRLQRHGADTAALAVQVVGAGAALPGQISLPVLPPQPEPTAHSDGHWIATGNQLAGLGALEAGIRFVAAYPITPASDALEWMASRIESLGGHLVQAEDELAAVNMAIGAAYGGVPAMTATSGPGLALMSEAMGLAIASETPLLILDVMRGGPSTGIPTKSEQSDFNLALYGMHGDAPHIVLAALSIADCHFSSGLAVQLASACQTLAILLSDQFVGQSMQIMPALPQHPFQAQLARASLPPAAGADYFRYLDTASGISPMALPGEAGGMYTADGLEHNEHAVPSARARDHELQLAKRLRKLQGVAASPHWGECSSLPDARVLVLCWGSLYPVALEAQQQLQAQGVAINVVGIRLLSPLPEAQLRQALAGMEKVLLIEQNQQGQFAHYLRGFDFEFDLYQRAGPRRFTPGELVQKVLQWMEEPSHA